MASLNRGSSNRFATTIWPGYVDAMTTLLMVLIFVLTIFIVVQSMLRERITDQDSTITRQTEEIAARDRTLDEQQAALSAQEQRLGALGEQVADLAAALSMSEQGMDAEAARAAGLVEDLAEAESAARDRAAQLTRLNAELQTSRAQLQAQGADLESARRRITDFEAEVAALLSARQKDQTAAEAAQARLATDLAAAEDRASAADLAVASARAEIDAQAEQARLAAARRDALNALVADLRARNSGGEARSAELQSRLTEAEGALSEAEAARLAEAEAARALRARLQRSDAELTAMTLALEESRKRAEETLTLLAAAEAAKARLTDEARAQAAQLTQAEKDAALLASARAELADEQALSAEGQKRVALLNEQVAGLTAELGRLQGVLDATGADQKAAELRVADLGKQLNAALLLAAEEKDRRLGLEAEARQKAEAEAKDLARYRSEFFGRLSQILEGRAGVKVVGDRFVFDSNVLFEPGEASLSPEGEAQIRSVAEMLGPIAAEIPPEIDWVIRVDGHTDNLPLSGTGRYRDNWELSQARALAVVRFMIDRLGFAAGRLAPTGFADTRPVATEDTPEGRALNRRIELKLTER